MKVSFNIADKTVASFAPTGDRLKDTVSTFNALSEAWQECNHAGGLLKVKSGNKLLKAYKLGSVSAEDILNALAVRQAEANKYFDSDGIPCPQPGGMTEEAQFSLWDLEEEAIMEVETVIIKTGKR